MASGIVSPDPTFSISVPVSGQAEFLGTALQSIHVQTPHVELAVLDASADDLAEKIVREYESSVAYHYHHADAGQAAAIREGWEHTRGDILGWLNSDDYYFPDALARVADVFRTRPEVDVVYGHGVHVSATGAFQMYFPAVDRDIRSLRRGCVVCQPACFVRRAAVERVGGLDPTLHYVMDWDLWLRLHRAGSTFHFLEAPLAAVRIHEGTKTLSGAAERYREIRTLLRTAGVPWARRLASVMAFRSYDLRNRRGGVLGDIGRQLLTTAAATRGLLRRRPRINGLECWTNRVERECVVELPWYDQQPPRGVTLVSDHAVELSLVCNGRPTTVQRCGAVPTTFLGERIAGQGYRASIAPGSWSTLSFRVASRDAPWRLLSLAAVA